MTYSFIQNSFIAGEISPSLYGRTDLAKYHSGAATMRNFFANYRGGASSRAGFAYVGMCKQAAPNAGGTATNNPPRDITFQFNINQGYALEFGDQYMRIKYKGAYIIETSQSISGITQANPAVINIPSHGFSVGDWIFITGVGGMTAFNGLTWIVNTVPDSNHITLTDLFGTVINSTLYTPYTSGGTAARIYTVVSPYAAIDLPYLKFTQSADTMSLCCVNQDTLTEYPPYELTRNGSTNWTFTKTTFTASISAPTGVTVTAAPSTTLSTWYSYVVTAISAATGEESVASTPAQIENNDIAVNAGSNNITWAAVSGASSYNIYKATPSYGTGNPVTIGVSYGYVGSAFGSSFTDTNITADFTTVPPVHSDPFARGKITQVTITNGGSTYTQATVGYTISTTFGSGFVGTPVVVGGAIAAFVIQNSGSGYATGDTITITGGSGGAAMLVFGPETGTYPGVVQYFQQRRGYANTTDNPDEYFFSQPGAFKNMDASIPVTDSDAITGAPWAQQINGIQFLQPMPSGLIVLTGNGAWLLSGVNGSAFTPSSQSATPEAYNGCNNHVPPIVVNYDILYVQSKGSIVRDLAYNFFVNIYTGTDITVLSNHLFNYNQIEQWAYAEEPYKLIWAIRDDGIMLSLTYLKEQDVYAWSRHDTNGFFVSVCSVTEPPVDSIYVIVKRFVRGQWVFYSERMDNRNWQNAEDSFCVDAGLSYPMNFPNATLMAASAEGTQNISSVNVISNGSGYTAPTVVAIDPTGQGTGATFTATVSGGKITAITPVNQGSNYQTGTFLEIFDATGSGAITQAIVTNNVTFTASSSVFTSANVGDVIRIGNNNATVSTGELTTNGGGQAVVTSYVSGTQVVANILQPITATIPNDPNNTPVPANSGQWSISTPVKTVTGLNHLEGLTVSILADGGVLAQQVVTNGAVTLQQAASQVTVGLPYTCQVQTLYVDPPNFPVNVQGKRKNINSVVARFENSRGMSIGTNQPDQSTEPNNAAIPWTDMVEVKERNALITAGNAIPLYTGDHYKNVDSAWSEYGQVAVQQTYPLPCNLLALSIEFNLGDMAQ